MKLNKLISKGLALGIILNSISVISYASTEIPNRYQTLEGEYITIDDSMEGNLEEIEIFGNTVQDENNLEDIQSVGDLYVDEDGNPILDKQGREQYKIDIVSQNKNILSVDKNFIVSNNGVNVEYLSKSNGIKLLGGRAIISNTLNLLPNTYYTLSLNSSGSSESYILSRAYDSKNNQIGALINDKMCFLTDNTGLIYFKFWTAPTANGTPDIYGHYVIYDNIQLESGKHDTNFVYPNYYKQSILLPAQLQKVGDIADRLYWDNSKGRYIIEKKIGSFIIDGTEPVRDIETTNDIYIVAQFTKDLSNFITGNNLDSINNMGIKNTSGDNIYTGIYDGVREAFVIRNSFARIKILKSRLTEEGLAEDLEGVAKYFNKYNFVSYMIINPKLIETNITSKIKIPTYDEKTHIYVSTENNTNPTLKVTVDRFPQIAKEAVAQAESDNTNHNISLARTYINMLPESSYKDQLQNQLSDVFSSDMVLDRKLTTSNLDVYIKSENILQISLDTNSINFDDFSGIEDVVKENAVNITINSSLPYQINAYLPAEIQNSDKTKTLDKSILNVKESRESDYKEFSNINEKVVLKDNCSSGNQLVHGVDLKLAGGIAHEKDVYKATIKLEAEQK